MWLSVVTRNNNLYTYNNYIERVQTKKEQKKPQNYLLKQQYLNSFYNRGGVCLLRGKDWILKYN
jgi:hypothetical protein